jgi:hypothetical protein
VKDGWSFVRAYVASDNGVRVRAYVVKEKAFVFFNIIRIALCLSSRINRGVCLSGSRDSVGVWPP